MQNFILADNISEQQLAAVLQKLADLYRHSGFTQRIELSGRVQGTREFLVTFQQTPDFEHFAYFVNYIRYPEGLEVADLQVKGFYKMKATDSGTPFRANEVVQLYISRNDSDYVNVSVVTPRDETYLYDFGGNVKKLEFTEEKYSFAEMSSDDYSLLKTIEPVPVSSEMEPSHEASKPWWKFWS